MLFRSGKKIFKNKAVIGGFDSRPGSLIHSGEKVDIEHYTEQLLSSTGDLRGIILGADCTIPSDIDLERLDWVRNRAVEFQKAYGKRREE